jgi:hypothetical protein
MSNASYKQFIKFKPPYEVLSESKRANEINDAIGRHNPNPGDHYSKDQKFQFFLFTRFN